MNNANSPDIGKTISHRWMDIRIWIALFFLIRLVGITNPPLETGHNWRQSMTNMIARNFVEHRANLFFPEIDYSGSNPGIIGSEFPFFNYLIYLFSILFDYHHWYGRLINLVVSSFGMYSFYHLVSKLANLRVAFPATIILLSSIWFAFSRKIMPDTFSVSLVIIGLNFGYDYLMSGRWINLLFFFLFSTLGMLCKIPALYLFAGLPLLFFAGEIPLDRRKFIWAASSFSVALVGVWYFYWVPHLVSTYHNQLYFPRGLWEGFREIASMAEGFFRNFYFNAFHSYTSFAVFIAGIYFVYTGKTSAMKWGLMLLTFTFLLFILKTGIVFPLHNYYIIPFVPVMALVAGMAIERVPAGYRYFILLVIVAEGVANQQHDFFIREKEGYKMAVEKLTDRHTQKKDLVVINGGPSPQELYLAHRKGWSVTNDQLTPDALMKYKDAGAVYLIINRRTFSDPIGFYPKRASEGEYDLYTMQE